MSIYVAEIDGRPIVAFRAETDIEAEQVAEAEWFLADLQFLESGGKPLWNGASEIHVREAVEEERAQWESSRAKSIIAGKTDAEDSDWLTFLVPVVDPADDEA